VKKVTIGLLLMVVCTLTTSAQKMAKKPISKVKDKVDIYHFVPFIPQPTSVSCWSASLAMILWWCENEKTQSCLQEALTPQQVATNIKYFQQFFGTGGKRGLNSFDAQPLSHYGFVRMPVEMVSQPAEYYIDLIKNGPVWIAYEGCTNPVTRCGHAVVMVGMKGDGTFDGTNVIIHDPDDGSGAYPNLGVRDRAMTLAEFEQRLTNRILRIEKNSTEDISKLNFMAYKVCN